MFSVERVSIVVELASTFYLSSKAAACAITDSVMYHSACFINFGSAIPELSKLRVSIGEQVAKNPLFAQR